MLRKLTPLLALSLLPAGAFANTLTFSLDTSTLGDLFAPGNTVTALFQLTSITPGTTALTITSFLPIGSPPSVFLSDVNFFNQAAISFTMGPLLSFIANFSTLSVDPNPTPDFFGLYLMDANGNILATTDVNGILLFGLNIDSLTTPTLDVYNAFDGSGNEVTPSVSFSGSGPAPIPEPSAYLLAACGLGALAAIRNGARR